MSAETKTFVALSATGCLARLQVSEPGLDADGETFLRRKLNAFILNCEVVRRKFSLLPVYFFLSVSFCNWNLLNGSYPWRSNGVECRIQMNFFKLEQPQKRKEFLSQN